MGAGRLEQLIFRHYARSALVPIVTIELLLLVIYFGVNAWTTHETEVTLEGEVRAVLPHLAAQHADAIDAEFQQVERQTAYFARAHEDLFASPRAFPIGGEPPAFEVAPNGALVQSNRTEWSSLYFTHADRLTDAQKEKARFTAALDPLYRHVVRDVPNVVAAYLNTHDDMNRLYPFIPKVWEQYPPDLNMEEYNFYYLADPQHDPAKKPVWTGVYLDPAGQGWMLSCVAPVYHAGALEGVVGLDVTVANIVKNVLELQLPWRASAFLTDDSGMILAMTPAVEELFGLRELKAHVYDAAISKERLKPEGFNLLKSPDPAVAARFQQILASNEPLHTLEIRGRTAFMVQGRVPVTGWRLFIEAEQDDVFRSIREMASASHRVGLGIVALMLAFYLAFFAFLRRRARVMAGEIARPLTELTVATQQVATSAAASLIPLSGITELDALTDTFNHMSSELDARSRQLVETRVEAQVQQKEAELAYARGMYESASGYLHNVGNSATRMNGSLVDLDEVLRSTAQYPAVFEVLRAAMASSPERPMLERFEAVLVEKTVPRLRAAVAELHTVAESIQRTLQHQQASFRGAHHLLRPQSFDVSALARQVVEEYVPASGEVQVELAIAPEVRVQNHRNQVYDGLVNVVKNAVESMGGRGVLRVVVEPLGDGGARIEVHDTGAGVRPEHVGQLLRAGFTTKAGGTGLGLHAFAVFLAANAGRIAVESDGPGKGATVHIEVRHV